MGAIQQITPLELDEFVGSYDYDPLVFLEFDHSIITDLRNYAGPYGIQVDNHLQTSSATLRNYMRYLGYDEQTRAKISASNRIHDGAKVYDEASIYNIDGSISDEVKAQRKLHPFRITELLENTVRRFPHLAGHPHLSVADCVGRFHHDRINGYGPMNDRSDSDAPIPLGRISQMVGIVDTYDGKMLVRPGRAPKSHEQVLAEMGGAPNLAGQVKHPVGEFDMNLLRDFGDHFNATGAAPNQPHRSRDDQPEPILAI